MKFSYNWLQSFFNKKLPSPEKIAKILTMHSFGVEDVEKIKIGKKADWLMEIEILPNRPDCYSHLGIAREIATLLNLKLKLPEIKIKEENSIKAKDLIEVEVKKGCLRYTGRVILAPEVGESPDWLKSRLEVCGMGSINNVVDITNYVMLEVGQPLHAFDLERIEGKKVLVREAKEGERILTLDEEEYELDKDVLVIADSKRPIAIAGIKGGKETAISENTQIVFLEGATFEKEKIKRGSRKIDLVTDASFRFTHGLDPNLTELGINRATNLIQRVCKAKVAKGMIDFYPKKVLPKRMMFDLQKTNSILGIEIPEKKQTKILERLNFKVKEKKKGIEVLIPTFRSDISIPEDLVEEIGRIFGYHKIHSSFPLVYLIPPKKNLELFWEDFVKDNLKSLGFSEVMNYSFLSLELAKKSGFLEKDLMEIQNPVSLKYQYLRPSLICHLLRNVKQNLPHFKKIKIFEIGKIFKKENAKFREKKILAGLITGDFFELKGILDTLLSQMGISDFWFDFYKPTPEDSKSNLWHLKKSSEIKIGKEEIGFLGEISQKVLVEFGLQERIVGFEIDFEKLPRLATEETEYEPISPYPAILRDISILVPNQVLVEEVSQKIELFGRELVEDVDLIDIFEEFQEGKKSLTFRITFRAKDRALDSDEVEEVFKKIVKKLEKNPNWEVRK
jgi:phenylalanyl-tRNA synthetase beta chain